jgi:hypothetical protein
MFNWQKYLVALQATDTSYIFYFVSQKRNNVPPHAFLLCISCLGAAEVSVL